MRRLEGRTERPYKVPFYVRMDREMWTDPLFDLKASREKWRKTFAKLLDIDPSLLNDWTVEHLMREMISTRRLALEESSKQ